MAEALDPRELPRSGPWEVDVVDVPGMEVDGMDLEGVLLVVDAASGAVRHARPVCRGEDITGTVVEAAIRPVPPLVPSRPLAIRCSATLRPRLAGAASALGVKLSTQSPLAILEDVAASLIASMSSGLPPDPAPWRPIVEELVRAAPWKALPDSVEFRFPSGPALLQAGLGVVLGNAGEQYGLAFYPTERDFDVFAQLADTGFPEDSPSWTCWCVHLDPLDEFPPRVRDLLRSSGLAASGLGLRLFAMEGFDTRALSAEEEAACLVMVEGVLGAWAAAGPALCARPYAFAVETSAGSIDVVAFPAGLMFQPEPRLVDVDHQIGLAYGQLNGIEQPILVLKMAKRDALRFGRLLEGLDGLSLDDGRGGYTQIIGWRGDEELGVLAELEPAPSAWARWRRAGGGSVAISAGGARRAGFRAKDFVSVHPVDFLES